MRLSKLTLNGFKSFADATEFTFDEAITAIVGPNGCGKSNVVDAVKWVLGERSSKSLRGAEMLDVIFAGSAGRKPAGMASVTLTFDNPEIEGGASAISTVAAALVESTPAGVPAADPAGTAPSAPAGGEGGAPPAENPAEAGEPATMLDAAVKSRRALPIDTDEVAIERRLYRDGTSEYLINGKKARLKDIRELFLDTGVGADSYCIIEQGKVDAMLMANPQERRSIFEEAAGIAKFRVRKAEASRKLERTEQNLAVTREQLESTARRLKLVKGQAARARTFRELDAEWRALKLALWLEQYHDLIERLKGLTSRLSELDSVRNEAVSAVTDLERQKQEAELRRHDLADEQRKLELRLQQATHDQQAATQREAAALKQVESIRAALAGDEEQLRLVSQKTEDAQGLFERLGDLVASLGEQQAEAECALATLARSKSQLGEHLASLRTQANAKRHAAGQIDRERAGLLAAIERDQQRAAAVLEQIAALAAKVAANAGDAQSVAQRRAALDESLATRRGTLANLEGDESRLNADGQRLATDRRAAAEKLAELEQSHARLEARRATLEEMVRSRAGLGDAVRHVLKAREQGSGFGGVVGVLADILQTEQAHAPAVEAALGSLLQAVVVPSLAALPTTADINALPGRATFLPLASPRAEPVAATAPSELADHPHVTPLRSLVRPREWTRHSLGEAGAALLDRLLDRTYLVPDLDAAMLLSAGPLAGARFVTVAGAVLEPDGRVVAGPTGKGEDGGGVLVRQSELDALAVKIEEAGRDLGAAREALQSLDGTAARLADELARVRAALGAERSAIAGEQSRVEQLSTDAGRLERERISLEGEIASLRQRSAQLERERGELITRAEQLRGLHADQLESAGKLEAQANQAQADADAVLEKITAAKVNAGRLAEQLSSARRERQQVEWSIEEGRRRMGTLQNNLKTRQAALVEQNQIAAEARALIASAAEESQELHKQVIGAAHAVSGAVAAAHALGEQLQTAREHARAVERDWHSLEVAKREGEIKREGMEDKIGVELAMDHAVVYGEYLEMIWGQEPLGAMDHVATQARVDELREDIKALGNVNLDAIEEESQLAGRNDSLAAQVADLDQARRDLSSLIEQLNSASRERFRITFEAIQEHFAGEQGMFRRLFGGGKAEVKLMPLVRDGMETTDTDWLESGIEIVARPPGKQPHVISQLSGGEKAMTAVALLMSIFRSKPSCFCILDEVDAALDDANVERFAGVVRQFTSFSHFIVITHHKRTMHSADQLYGVTMQERGVSTRVNVKLEQVGAGGEIKSASEPDGALRRGLAGMREAQNAKV